MSSALERATTLYTEIETLQVQNEWLQERVAELEQKLQEARRQNAALELLNIELERRMAKQATDLDLFVTLVETSPDGIFTVRLDDMSITYINPAGYRMMGYNETMIGMPLTDLVLFDSPDFFQVLDGSRTQVNEDGYWQGVIIYQRQDGTTFPGEVSTFVIHDIDGRPQALANIIRDISGRIEVEEALRESRAELQKFYMAVEQSASSILITDPQGRIEYVNPRFTEITGYPAEDVIGQNPRILKSDETPNATYESLWQTIAAGKKWRGEFRNKRKNGDIYWEGASILPITNKQGRVTNFLSVSQDITDRKRAEDALRQNEERFRRLAENARDLIFRYRFTPTRGFEYVSPSVKTIMGFTPEEYYADPDIDLKRLHPDSRTVFAISDESSESYRERIIMRYIRKDGSDVWIEQNHYQVRDDNGKTVAIEGISRDITDRKKAEEALRNNLQFLETLLNTIPSPVFYKDMDGQYRGCNRLFAQQILGLPDEHITFRSLYDEAESLPLDRVEVNQELDAQLIDENGLQMYVSSIPCADGVVRDFVISRATFVDADGRVAGIVGVMQDITERIRMEEELKTAYHNVSLLTNRLQDELNMAHRVQESLLPPPTPNWPEVDVICYNQPAREVGGDLYAYYPSDIPLVSEPIDNYILAVGDVSGKGMPAALLMAVSLASFRSIIGQELTPSDVLASLDEAIGEYTRTTHQNCAMAYVHISPNRPDNHDYIEGYHYLLRVANAGCIFPIVKRTDGSVEWMEVGGLPLGVGVGAQEGYEEIHLGLHEGDMVILTSDGTVEAKDANDDMFTFERLEAAVAAGPQSSASAMLLHLQDAVEQFIGETELQDDVTIVVMQV